MQQEKTCKYGGVHLTSNLTAKIMSDDLAWKFKHFELLTRMEHVHCELRNPDMPRDSKPIPPAKMEIHRVYSGNPQTGSYSHHAQIALFHGRYYCAWSNGIVNEDAAGQRVLISSSADGRDWSSPVSVAGDRSEPVVSYCCQGLVTRNDLLFLTVLREDAHRNASVPGMRRIDPDSQQAILYCSSDGFTWKKIHEYDGSVRMFFEGPRQTASGRLLCVGKTNTGPGILLWPGDDLTQNPKVVSVPPPPGVEFHYGEGSWYQTQDGAILVFQRDDGQSCRLWLTVSTDGGESFSEPIMTDIPDSMSRLWAGRLADGRYCICNNASTTLLDRSHLFLLLSRDGYCFDDVRVLVGGNNPPMRHPGLLKTDGVQYPSCIVDGGKLLVGYSLNKEDVEFGILTL